MSKPIIIVKDRFLEFGKKSPPGSRFKGTVTAESLGGLAEYYDRKEASEEADGELVRTEQSYLAYTSRQGFRTFGQNGFIKNSEIIKTINQSFNKNGNLAFDFVFSLRDFEVAKKLDCFSANDYQRAFARVLPSFFRKVGLDPKNVTWWGNYHSNTDNPHCHFVFMEKEQTRTKGTFTKKQLKYLKAQIAKELNVMKLIDRNVTEKFESKDDLYKNLTTRVNVIELSHEEEALGAALINLFNLMPETGRLQYNSENMKELKPQVDSIVRMILETDSISTHFGKWFDAVKSLDKNQDKAIGGVNTNLQESELKKLYSYLGNMVIKTKLQYDDILKGSHHMIQVPIDSILSRSEKNNVIRIDLKRDDGAAIEIQTRNQVDLKESVLLSYDTLEEAILTAGDKRRYIEQNELLKMLSGFKATDTKGWKLDRMMGSLYLHEKKIVYQNKKDWEKAVVAYKIKAQAEIQAIKYLNQREREIEREIESFINL